MHWYDNLSENTRITLVGVLAISIVTLVEFDFGSNSAVDQLPATAVATPPVRPELLKPMVDHRLDQALLEQTTRAVTEIDPLFETLMRTGSFGALKNRLLTMASDAVSEEDPGRLAEILALLGQVSIEQQNLGAAEVYLFEALDILDQNDDQPAKAEIYMQLGRTYLKSRQIARDAGYAYDALQIGRTQLTQGRLQLAESNIRYAIEHSLSIHRYNGAASGYETLAKLYQKLGDSYEYEQALLEAARLYSSSGQTDASLALVDRLKSDGMEQWRLLETEQQISSNKQTYEDSIRQIGTAKDYRRLYNYYLNQGDTRRAWHFRLLASQSLEEVSKRAMFHRQQGVLALLYNSNDAMTKAKHYFSSASSRFKDAGHDTRLAETARLNRRVY